MVIVLFTPSSAADVPSVASSKASTADIVETVV